MVGTVRDNKNESKIAPLREGFGIHFDKLELREADLLNDESMDKAIAGATYLIHVASPFYLDN